MGLFGPRKTGGIPRRAERYLTQGLSCPLGELVDLSATGMQIRARGRPAAAVGEIHHFTISSSSQRLDVTGRVMWVKRSSWSGFRIGVQFHGLKPGVDAVLAQLAKYGFVGRQSPETSARREAPTASMEVEDLYGILGVQSHATQDEIHAAYRALARTLHPDVCRDQGAGERFVLVSKAYSVLKDAERRRKYDRLVASCA